MGQEVEFLKSPFDMEAEKEFCQREDSRFVLTYIALRRRGLPGAVIWDIMMSSADPAEPPSVIAMTQKKTPLAVNYVKPLFEHANMFLKSLGRFRFFWYLGKRPETLVVVCAYAGQNKVVIDCQWRHLRSGKNLMKLALEASGRASRSDSFKYFFTQLRTWPTLLSRTNFDTVVRHVLVGSCMGSLNILKFLVDQGIRLHPTHSEFASNYSIATPMIEFVLDEVGYVGFKVLGNLALRGFGEMVSRLLTRKEFQSSRVLLWVLRQVVGDGRNSCLRLLAEAYRNACGKREAVTMPYEGPLAVKLWDNVKILLDADPNGPTAESVYMILASNGPTALAKEFLDRCLDPQHMNGPDLIPLTLQGCRNRLDFAQYLVRSVGVQSAHGAVAFAVRQDWLPAGLEIIVESVRCSDSTCMKCAIDLNHAVVIAAEKEDSSLISWLIVRGASPDFGGDLPLRRAYEFGKVSNVRLLHKLGAGTTPGGRSVLHSVGIKQPYG